MMRGGVNRVNAGKNKPIRAGITVFRFELNRRSVKLAPLMRHPLLDSKADDSYLHPG